MKQTTFNALLRIYMQLESMAGELYDLADDAVETGDFDAVISELEE